ncbi:hypothetical protein PR048_021130 [Dryococelus australis]|uniref:Secreted protein n=1 Tax=Dryococelus australis TaxID=614101 RepID=A0ABQ9GXF4_9NEOP|nr:hypothetical protein PR048_021130 [Dryococelus australis]
MHVAGVVQVAVVACAVALAAGGGPGNAVASSTPDLTRVADVGRHEQRTFPPGVNFLLGGRPPGFSDQTGGQGGIKPR